MPTAAQFTDWFDKQRFRHFQAYEFTRYFEAVRRGVRNGVPPRSLWPNLVEVLRVADDLRESFGRPCLILSSYRSADFNRAVGGAPMSHHLAFRALDLRISGVPSARVYQRLLDWRREGRFSGGLGLYPSARFVHLDTRGTNANWRGR